MKKVQKKTLRHSTLANAIELSLKLSFSYPWWFITCTRHADILFKKRNKKKGNRKSLNRIALNWEPREKITKGKISPIYIYVYIIYVWVVDEIVTSGQHLKSNASVTESKHWKENSITWLDRIINENANASLLFG